VVGRRRVLATGLIVFAAISAAGCGSSGEDPSDRSKTLEPPRPTQQHDYVAISVEDGQRGTVGKIAGSKPSSRPIPTGPGTRST
jgi:hypothetical protein